MSQKGSLVDVSYPKFRKIDFLGAPDRWSFFEMSRFVLASVNFSNVGFEGFQIYFYNSIWTQLGLLTL